MNTTFTPDNQDAATTPPTKPLTKGVPPVPPAEQPYRANTPPTMEGARSLRLVKPRPSGRRIAATFGGLIALIVAALVFVPWQQTIVGYGDVTNSDPMNRPQNVEAQISGRLVQWNVQEGDTVKEGDVIAKLQDIDSKFLDPEQAKQLRDQRAFAVQGRKAAENRAKNINKQIASATRARQEAVQLFTQRIEQAKEREKAARQLLVNAQISLKTAVEIGNQSAKERADQARDTVRVAEQRKVAQKEAQEKARLQLERIRDLYKQDLRSKRDLELAEQDYVQRVAAVREAQAVIDQARRGTNLGVLAQDEVRLRINAAQADVERQQNNLNVARQDIITATLERNRVMQDLAANIDGLEGSRQSALESAAKNASEIQKIEVDLRNLTRRNEQQIVKAPRSGEVVRMLTRGPGETVKAGDILCRILPQTEDQAVALYVTDNDVPLIAPGRKVRLQFAGWPALQFSGFPSVAVGTFGGVVSVVDAVDDGTARYRVLVRPDTAAIAKGEDVPWPKQTQLRPGAESTGWILLDTVPLGFELWRQFNAFPPTVKRPPIGEKAEKGDAYEYESKDKEKMKSDIKIPKRK